MPDIKNRPNILWICTDQQRFDTLGCYGNPFVHTPNLDRLAAGGMLFSRCYSQSPVCSPSRGSFLTGRYPRTCRIRQNGHSIPPEEVLVTRMFRDAGYVCGLSGKLHIAPCHPSVCHDIEERIDDGYSAFHWSHHPANTGNGKNNWALNEYSLWLTEHGTGYAPKPYHGSRYVQEGMPEKYHQTTWCTEKAANFIRANAAYGNNWLFSVNYFDPHHPFDPPKELLDRYMDKLQDIPLPNYVPGELDNKPVFQQIDHAGAYGNAAGFPYDRLSEEDHRLVRAAYWAMIDLVDRQVGRLLETLEETGQRENTLIIFTSDHGEMLGDHGIYLKGPYFYEPAVHVPLLVACPSRIPAGRTSDALVELVDLPQTLLDAAGMQYHPGMQGKSFWQLLTGEKESNVHREDVYCEYYNAMPWHKNPAAHGTMVFDGRYKLAVAHGTGTGELYDLEKDSAETRNLWTEPEYAAVKAQMLVRLTDRMAWTCDPLGQRVSAW